MLEVEERCVDCRGDLRHLSEGREVKGVEGGAGGGPDGVGGGEVGEDDVKGGDEGGEMGEEGGEEGRGGEKGDEGESDVDGLSEEVDVTCEKGRERGVYRGGRRHSLLTVTGALHEEVKGVPLQFQDCRGGESGVLLQ